MAIKKLQEILLRRKVGPGITKQFEKHEEILRVKDEFIKSGKLIELHSSDILDDVTFQIRSEKVAVEDFENLKASLKTNGQQVPILVRKKGDKYQLIAGFNRYQALKELHKTIQAIFKDVDDNTAFIIAEIENLQRNDLSFIDMYKYINKLQKTGLNNVQIAERLNKSRRIIQYYVQIGTNPGLFNLVKKEVISIKEAIALSRLSEKELAKRITDLGKINESGAEHSKVRKAAAVKTKEIIIDKDKNKIKISLSDTYGNKERVIKKLQDIISELKNT